MNCLIACHAGTGVGLGHLMRSLIAARALRSTLGAEVALLVQGESINLKVLQGFNHVVVNSDEGFQAALWRIVDEFSPDALLLDLYPAWIDQALVTLLEKVRKTGCKVVAVDGMLECYEVVDLFYFPSFRNPHFEPQIGAAPIVYGWDCFLLNVPTKIPEWKPSRRGLALTGGSDVTGLGNHWPQLLDEKLPSGIELDWVTGPYAEPPTWPMEPRIEMRNQIAPNSLEHLMAKAGFASTVFGVSFFELLYFGVPTVVFSPYGDKDSIELTAIRSAEVALVAEDEFEATDLIVKLINHPDRAMSLSKRAREHLRNANGQRLAQEVKKAIH